jgi:hypothetical protein
LESYSLREVYTIIYFIDFYIGYLNLDNSVISKASEMDVIRKLLQDMSRKIQPLSRGP